MNTAVEQSLFPDMPVAAPTKQRNKWDEIKEIAELSRKHGQLLPQMFASPILGVTSERVFALVQENRFRTWQFLGKTWLCEDDLLAYGQSDRRAGRPKKERSKSEVFKAIHKAAKAQ
jgi:hypothetical protein